MMYFLIILFFGSLSGIVFMVGKKFLMLQGGQTLSRREAFFEAPHLEEWKQTAIKNIKRHGYVGLVATIRTYFRFANFLKNKYQETKNKIKEIHIKRQRNMHPEKKEVSSFLKMVSEYKNKIRKIKERVKEEENL